MSKPRKSYTKEEKLEVVKLSLNDDQSIQQLAERFRISVRAIYNWRSKYLKKAETAFPGKENKEMTESDRTIHELK